MRKLIAIYMILLAVCQPLAAQVVTAGQYEEKAKAAFARQDYNAALEFYNIILLDHPKRADLLWPAGEAARITRHFAAGERYLQRMYETDEWSKYPELPYKLGLLKKSLGKYDDAIESFKTYMRYHINGPWEKACLAEIAACEWAKEKTADRPYELIHLDENINTIFIDAAPIQYGDKLYYTSAYFANATAAPVTHLYASDFQSKGRPLAINAVGEKDHTAHYTLNPSQTRAYYNVCNQQASGQFLCAIYARDRQEDGNWGAAVKLDTAINTPTYTATQPTVGFDSTLRREVLYFVSDRPGGKGGLDIWKAILNPDGVFEKPENLSDINTDKDDITPFFVTNHQTLLFSSEGYLSVGGFDVYRSKRQKEGWGTPENLGFPLNSSYDEMYASFNQDSARYFLVSNREGGLCGKVEKDCICNDIYQQNIVVKLETRTFLVTSTDSLTGCTIALLDLETGKTVATRTSTEGAFYAFDLEVNKSYKIIASKPGYVSDTLIFNTKQLFLPVSVLKKDLILKPNLKMQVFVYDEIDRKPLNGATVEIREGRKTVAKQTLSGHTLLFDQLEWGKTYWIYAEKETYERDSVSDKTEVYSAIVSKFVYNDTVYLTPFTNLPLTLYYDNDHPNPRTTALTTDLTYSQTYMAYSAKRTEYLSAYYKDSKEVSSAVANEITNFFTDHIDFGYNKLIDFSKSLYRYLQTGHGLEIVIEGYASPLALNDYNKNLTSRRVSAVINHFNTFNNGAMRPYLQKGQLRIRVEPYGEEKASAGVSDNAKDRRSSVYSVAAMRERKVEIKEINKFPYQKSDTIYKSGDNLGLYLNLDAPMPVTPSIDLTYESQAWRMGTSIVTQKGILADSLSAKLGGDILVLGETDLKYAAESVPTEGVAQKSSQKLSITFIDAFTQKVVKTPVQLSFYDAAGEKELGTASIKGQQYEYKVAMSQTYVIRGGADGYSTFEGKRLGRSSAVAAADVVSDTVLLVPFSGVPLFLYFDNDKPQINKKAIIPAYEETYKSFLARKNTFIKAYNESLPKAVSAENRVEMSDFFEYDVEEGYEKLSGFCKILEDYLAKGYDMLVVIEGHASPLADYEYNKKLAERRIQSLYNQFTSYDKGRLKRYIKSGQLRIKAEPIGESKQSAKLEAENDPNNSIYSVEASKERRVVVKDIIILNNTIGQ